jgi:hypothetical protein
MNDSSRLFLVLVGVLFMTSCVSIHPIAEAVESGDVQRVEALIDQGPDKKENAEIALRNGGYFGNTSILQLALSRGAAIDSKDETGHSALFWAAWNGHARAVQFLLDNGADPQTTNEYGEFPLSYAASSGHTQVVRLLLERGAVVNEDMLLEPREKGYATIVRLLEEAQLRQAGLTKTSPASQSSATAALEPTTRVIPSSDVDRVPTLKTATKKNAYAVVIGIEQYREKLPKADFAERDAKLVGEYLTKVLGYPEENVIVRTNDRATRTDLVKYFEDWLRNNVEKDSSVFVYYSGHGAPNTKTGEAYFVPYDGDPSFVDSTAYPVRQLYAALDKLPAKDITVVLDSCFSGAGGRSVLAKGARPMVLSVENPVLASGRTVVLAASGGDQISNSFEEKGHGLLTYYFLKGLQGDGDGNKDGMIEMAELYDYVKPNVQRVARKQYNNEQTPQLLASPDLLKRGGGRLLERMQP